MFTQKIVINVVTEITLKCFNFCYKWSYKLRNVASLHLCLLWKNTLEKINKENEKTHITIIYLSISIFVPSK